MFNHTDSESVTASESWLSTGFQIVLAATVANLMLVAVVSVGTAPAAWALALLVGIVSLGSCWFPAQNGPLHVASSRPDF
jgi:hypothetical protein